MRTWIEFAENKVKYVTIYSRQLEILNPNAWTGARKKWRMVVFETKGSHLLGDGDIGSPFQHVSYG